MEIFQQLHKKPPLDAIFVPLGSGALISGIAVYTSRVSPTTRVIGVTPRFDALQKTPSTVSEYFAGQRGEEFTPSSHAKSGPLEDGSCRDVSADIEQPCACRECLRIMDLYVDHVLTVGDGEIEEAIRAGVCQPGTGIHNCPQAFTKQIRHEVLC